MPSFRWSYVIPILCSVGSLTSGTAASAFQYPPLNDDLNTRQIHGADAWIEGEFRSTGNINQSPADFGPVSGMWSRTPDGNPASGDRFPIMQAGPLPGGLSPNGFNGSGMIPPVNQPDYIANNPAFGGRGFGVNGQMTNGNDTINGQFNGNIGPDQQRQFGANSTRPNSPFDPSARSAARSQQGMMSASAKQPYVGLLGQVARPGVYEITGGRETLGDLIEKIGGLAKDASGQLRVIRNGRPGQSTSYAAAAYFELLPGDLVIADAQFSRSSGTVRNGAYSSAQSGVAARPASAGSVQIGFVNLLDRPVVLKLRSEHANVPAILAMMRQDRELASAVKVVLPSGQSQRSQGQQRPDTPLPSETVLIFPRNAVISERLDNLPEPTMLNKDQSKDDDAQPPRTPPAHISPDVTQRHSPSQMPNTESAVTEVPPPPTVEYEHSQNLRSTPQRSGGVRGSTSEQTARDTNMALAPPAEGAAQHFDTQSGQSIGSLPTRDVAASTLTHDEDVAAAPSPNDSDWNEDRDPSVEPSRLNASRNRRPITEVHGRDQGFDGLDPDADGTSDSQNASGKNAASGWSIWPPLLTAGIGLLALLGFSLSLRRRTQSGWQQSTPRTSEMTHSPAAPTRTIPIAREVAEATVSVPVEAESPINNETRTQASSKHDLLESLITNQLPLTTEKVNFASPLQFHGRPATPRMLRLDNGHGLPKPHTPNTAPLPTRHQPEQTDEIASQQKTSVATRSFRLDQSTATAPASRFAPAKRAEAASSKLANTANSNASSDSQTKVGRNAGGPLDRALSAVQKREERS